MAHDVFISYSTKDKAVADAVCATLEARRIRCWIAPRDVMPGVAYAEALIDALNSSRLMVLVFSSNSNESPQVMREVERAVNKAIPIIPLRIENVMPSKAMEYFVSSSHWLDAMTPPLERHLHKLADTIQVLLSGETGEQTTVVTPYSAQPVKEVKGRKKPIAIALIVVSVALVLVVAGVIFFVPGILRHNVAPGGGLPPPPTQTAPPSGPPVQKNPSLNSSLSDIPLKTFPASGILFQDDFNDPNSGWQQYSNDTAESKYENGELSLLVKLQKWGSWVTNQKAGKFGDMVLEADARLFSGPHQSSYGLVFRWQNDNNFYRFLISGAGEYSIQKRANGIVFTPQKFTKSAFINQGETANHLKVVCKGSKIEVYCNGHPLAAIDDNSFSEGLIGVDVNTMEGPACAHFDNVTVIKAD